MPWNTNDIAARKKSVMPQRRAMNLFVLKHRRGWTLLQGRSRNEKNLLQSVSEFRLQLWRSKWRKCAMISK